MGENAADDSRESGVEFGDLASKLAAHDYPTGVDDLVSAYGDETLELGGEHRTLREVLEPLLETEGERTFEDTEEVRQTVFNMVGDEAVGRTGYSDRGGSNPEVTGEAEEVQEDEEDQSI